MKSISGPALLFLLFVASEAWSQTCHVNVTPITFGQYDRLKAAPTDSIGNIDISCDVVGTLYRIRLNPSQNTNGGFLPRMMRPSTGKDILIYNLYIDAAASQVWGDGTSSTFIQSGISKGGKDQFSIYGRLPAKQNIAPGQYSDLVAVTLEW